MSEEFVGQEYEVSQAGGNVKKGITGSFFWKVITSIFFSLAIIISVAAVAITVVFFFSEVDGPSMMTTVNANFYFENRVYDNVLASRYITAKRGDIIVVSHFDAPGSEEKFFLKRLIAIEGDKIRFERNYTHLNERYDTYKTILNDEPLDEWYLDDYWGIMGTYGYNFWYYINYGSYPGTSGINDKYEDHVIRNDGPPYLLIPEGHIFFMGDNRGSDGSKHLRPEGDFAYHSDDCTRFGPQPASYIKGVVVEIIKEEESLPAYALRKLGEFFTFGWVKNLFG